jgi:hypothetical protein
MYITKVRNRMIGAKFGKPLVERMGDDIVVAGLGYDQPVENSLQLETATHASEFEVAQPQLAMRKASFLTVGVEYIDGWVRH